MKSSDTLAVMERAVEAAEPCLPAASFAAAPHVDNVVELQFPPRSLVYRVCNRIFDLAGVVVIVSVLWWLILLLAVMVRFNCGRGVIFGHRRVGRHGRQFNCLKFRSMVPNAQQLLDELLDTDSGVREEWERDFKLKSDPRITPLGNFLRRTSLDELPQLWNVVRGDMSLVGPRPVVRDELDRYYGVKGRQRYYAVRPGMTGLWQVSGRSDMSYVERVQLDIEYVENASLFRDFGILVKTLGVVFRGKGAY